MYHIYKQHCQNASQIILIFNKTVLHITFKNQSFKIRLLNEFVLQENLILPILNLYRPQQCRYHDEASKDTGDFPLFVCVCDIKKRALITH